MNSNLINKIQAAENSWSRLTMILWKELLEFCRFFTIAFHGVEISQISIKSWSWLTLRTLAWPEKNKKKTQLQLQSTPTLTPLSLHSTLTPLQLHSNCTPTPTPTPPHSNSHSWNLLTLSPPAKAGGSERQGWWLGLVHLIIFSALWQFLYFVTLILGRRQIVTASHFPSQLLRSVHTCSLKLPQLGSSCNHFLQSLHSRK
jgi:hypothetical protein